MSAGIDSDERGDFWSSGHEHLAKQGRLGEIHRDIVSVTIKNEKGQVIRIFAKVPEPNFFQRISTFFRRE